MYRRCIRIDGSLTFGLVAEREGGRREERERFKKMYLSTALITALLRVIQSRAPVRVGVPRDPELVGMFPKKKDPPLYSGGNTAAALSAYVPGLHRNHN